MAWKEGASSREAVVEFCLVIENPNCTESEILAAMAEMNTMIPTWQDETFGVQLYLGDCRNILPLLPAVDSVITDPPYGIEAHTKQRRVRWGGQGRGSRYEASRQVCMEPLSFEPLSFEPLSFEPLSFEPLSFEPLSSELRYCVGSHIARLTKRWSLIFCQCEAAQLWKTSLEPMVYKRTAVWIKPDAMPQYSGDRPGMGYESIVCCHANGRSKWNGGGRVGVFTHNKNSKGKHVHETQKPVTLMCELVALFTDSGESIFDPFMGSGSTGVAAVQLGRKFTGIEISPKYFKVAVERIRKAIIDVQNGPIFAAHEPAKFALEIEQ
jgi:site-specific DNA-methyltransferase (adenine-specific)